MAGRQRRRQFGGLRKLPSGRWQASYLGPDGRRHTARTPDGGPLTFAAKADADGWLALRQAEILRGAWLPPAEPAPKPAAPKTLGEYATAWLAGRELSESTRRLYRATLAKQILPAFGATPLTEITPARVRDWHAGLRTKTGPRQRAAAYSLLRTIMATAVADEAIQANPCRVRGAGSAKRAKPIRPATLAELEAIVTAMPPRYRLMVLLAAWCALRFGELAELRRADIDLKNSVVRVRRGVIRTDDGRQVKDPKSEAGKRDVAIPPHLMPMVHDHLIEHAGRGPDALLFPAANGGHMAPSSLYAVYHPAREAAGRPDLRFHDLRHTGAVLAAATGATLAELMARLGHSTVAAAMRYQHAAADRDRVIAEALSDLAAAGTVTAISRARPRHSAHGAPARRS
jgi:integrase